MPTKPIGERAMSAGERSARNQAKIRQEFHTIRTILTDDADFLLKIGKKLSAEGQRELAHQALMKAEISMNQVKNINARLFNYEHEFTDWAPKPPPRKGFTLPDPREGLVFDPSILSEGERLQAAYAKKRADLRPLTDAKFGHLARSEKAEAAE